MNHLDAIAKLIAAENYLFARTYNKHYEIDWDSIIIIRKAVRELRIETAAMIGARLAY